MARGQERSDDADRTVDAGAPDPDMPCLGRRFESEHVVLDLNESGPFKVNFTCPGHVFSLQLGRRRYRIGMSSDRMTDRELPSGAVTFSPHGTTVRAVTGPESPEFLAFSVSDAFMAKVLEAAGTDRRALRNDPAHTHPTHETVGHLLRRAMLAGTASPLYVEAATSVILGHVVASWAGRVAAEEPPPLASRGVSRVQEYVRASLEGKHSLVELAAVAGVNPAQLSRAFRKATGQTPHQWVIGQRIETAREMLVTSDEPIAMIAAKVGFSSQAHLTNVFRRRMGDTPGRYRRSHR